MDAWHITRWFTFCWYTYLFSKPFNVTKLLCRMGGHKCGPVWYNPYALEPDMSCKNCGDET